MKQKTLILVLLLTLIMPVSANIVQDAVVTEEIPTKTTTSEIPFKQPVSKRALAKKFIFAMSGVAISSIALFIGLTAYNKVRNNVIKTATTDYANTLNSPDNLKDAVNIYLERTRN